MVLFGAPHDGSSTCVLHTLQTLDEMVRQTTQQAVAGIQARNDHGVDQLLSTCLVEVATNTSDSVEMGIYLTHLGSWGYQMV